MPPRDTDSQFDEEPRSSFPALWRVPTDRNVPFRNALDWLEGKRKDDGIPADLWRVYDKLYDLNSFAKKHPGGSVWLETTRGMDITESFESSHVVNVQLVEQTLEKFYVQDASTPRFSPYTFEPNGFFKTLKRRIQPILEEVGTGPSFEAKLIQDSLASTFITLALLGIVWNSFLLQTLAGFVLSLNVICAHNFFHLRDNWRKYYFDLSLLSSQEWRVSHALSHHLYPNTVLDAEISMFEPLFKFLPTKSKTWWDRYGPYLWTHPVLSIGFSLDFIKRWNAVLKHRQKFRPEFLISPLELVFFMAVAPTLLDAVVGWITIHFSSSYFFMIIALHGGVHHPPDCWHDGDQPRPDEIGGADFGFAQLDTIQERSDQWQKNLFVILVTFGEHSLHHLFPTICHSKLKYLKGVYEQTLNEFCEKPPTITQIGAFSAFYQQIQRIEPRPFKRGPAAGEKKSS